MMIGGIGEESEGANVGIACPPTCRSKVAGHLETTILLGSCTCQLGAIPLFQQVGSSERGRSGSACVQCAELHFQHGVGEHELEVVGSGRGIVAQQVGQLTTLGSSSWSSSKPVSKGRIASNWNGSWLTVAPSRRRGRWS